MPLVERELRKPGFKEGYVVSLADGQKWTLPKPRIRIRAKEVDGEMEVDRRVSFGDQYEQHIDVLFGVEEVSGYDRLKTEFKLLAALLRQNYELSSDQVSDLLVMDIDDEASDSRWESIRDALMGIQPKP